MTDTLRQSASITGQDVNQYSLHGVASPVEYAPPASNHADGTEEDDGQIHCICGFIEDDGNTVACDTCNRWQHILCYYPQYADHLPDDLNHWCVDCRPQTNINRQAAHVRQKAAMEQRLAVQNGVKRPAKQSHKKKVKDPLSAGLTNGWPLEKTRHDRNSASPRDAQPPFKRPKTSHRSSNSTVGALNNGQSRKRNGSTANHRRSVSRSPDTYIPLYTEEFIRAYRDDEVTAPAANVSNIAIYSAMNSWLYNKDEVLSITKGIPVEGLFQRWDGDASILTGQGTLEIREAHDPSFQAADGHYASWKFATLAEGTSSQACIGELRGHLEFKKDYQQDPANRWEAVRHPEPFVFFHSKLPICIDARQEGTPVRYIRRSCLPNAELRIIITGQSDYHFCFIAIRDIDPGEEICIAWDIPQVVTGRTHVPPKEMNNLRIWCSNALANCGPCACNRAYPDCMMSVFDKRGSDIELENDNTRPPKAGAKKRKAGHNISPLNTHAINSRSGSEARRIDPDDEPTDSRSASGSAGRGSASRDITPNTHYSTNGTSEMSERERKKLAKVEELFHKQEEEGTGRQSKKKRSSAGSTLNTPSLSSSKQFGLPSGGSSKYADAGTSRQSGLASAKSTNGRRPKSTAPSKPSSKPVTKAVKAAKPVYADSSVQCDMDEEEALKRPSPPRVRRPYMSLQQRLLERCARNNAMWKEQQLARKRSASIDNVMDTDADKPEQLHVSHDDSQSEAKAADAPLAPADQDVDMQDASAEPDADPTTTAEIAGKLLPKQENDGEDKSMSPPPQHLTANPPAPPWPVESTSAAAVSADKKTEALGSPSEPVKASDMHIPMPPPAANPSAAAGQPPLSAGTMSNNITGQAATQSPAALAPTAIAPPQFSPAVSAAVNPSPARKKLSLSDYTRRSKAKDRESEAKPDRESSPASVASGPVNGAVLQASSSDMARVKESGSAIEEDVRMEDAAAAP